MNSLRFLQSEFERNFAWARSAQPEVRADYIRTMPNLYSRVAGLAMLGFTRQFPNLSERMLGFQIDGTGYEYLGAGSKHTAIGDNEVVLKINRRSVRLPEPAKVELRDGLENEHRILRNYIGSMVLGQSSNVEDHPLRSTARAVVTRQERINFVDPQLFHGYAPTINREAVAKAIQANPGVEDDLRDLAQASVKLLTDHYMLPDVSGLNNLVIEQTSGELMLIGGLPINGLSDPRGIGRIAGQFLDLEDFLTEIR